MHAWRVCSPGLTCGDGAVAGLWEQQRRGSQLTIRVDPLIGLSGAQHHQLERQATRMAEFYGMQASLDFGHVEPRGHM